MPKNTFLFIFILFALTANLTITSYGRIAEFKEYDISDSNKRFSIHEEQMIYLHYAILLKIKVEDGTNRYIVLKNSYKCQLTSSFVKQADQLSISDTLLSNTGKKGIIMGVSPGKFYYADDYYFKNHELKDFVFEDENAETLDFYMLNVGRTFHVKPYKLPQIGTLLYEEKNKVSLLSELADTIILNENNRFVPYKKVTPGTNAVFFYPPEWGTPNESSLTSIDDPRPFDIFEKVKKLFNKVFPNIEITESVPASTSDYSHATFNQNKRVVHVAGNAIRHSCFSEEGLALLIAHEIAHHYGGEPKMTEEGKMWASCEGQSDYWAASECVEKILPAGSDIVSYIKRGAAQLFCFFIQLRGEGWPNCEVVNTSMSANICSHPGECCRYKTFCEGATNSPKPPCAGK